MSAVRGYAEAAADLADVEQRWAEFDDSDAEHPDGIETLYGFRTRVEREAAALLASVAAILPDCPTCGGTGELASTPACPITLPCPDCDHGKVTVEQLAATWQAVHDPSTRNAVAEQLGRTVYAGKSGRERDSWLFSYAGIMLDHLRSVRPPSPKEGT